MKRVCSRFSVAALTIICTAGFLVAQTSNDDLKKGFENPPSAARPRVWWHWMNGNITQEGIKLDLEWMHRAGIAGFQNFDAALQTPQVVDKRLAYMTPEWKEAFLHPKQALGIVVQFLRAPLALSKILAFASGSARPPRTCRSSIRMPSSLPSDFLLAQPTPQPSRPKSLPAAKDWMPQC